MKTSHLVIGGVIAAAVVGTALYASKHMNMAKARYAGSGTGRFHPGPQSGDELYRARLARKGSTKTPIEDSGITNVGQYDSGGVGWHGWRASPWSPMTEKNENYTYARTPTNKLLHTYKPGKLDHLRLQGAVGLTRYLPGITYTYW